MAASLTPRCSNLLLSLEEYFFFCGKYTVEPLVKQTSLPNHALFASLARPPWRMGHIPGVAVPEPDGNRGFPDPMKWEFT